MSDQRQPSALDAAPYLKALVDFRERRPTRLMVPGHKGGRAIPAALAEALGADGAAALLGLDIPLYVMGIDSHRPGDDDTGAKLPAAEARERAAAAWGAASTHFVLGGASQANHMVCAALSILSPGRRPRIAVQRNVHQSVIYGLILADAEVDWLPPEVDGVFGIEHGMAPDALDAALRNAMSRHGEEPGFDAVMLVSPTYYGAVSDVARLAEVVREHRTPQHPTLLVVDEAWGAHFPFSDAFPQSAVTSGADLVVSSIHKIVGSLAQSAMLHVGGNPDDKFVKVVDDAVSKGRHLVETTSPSSLLYASLDAARAFAEGQGGEFLRLAAENADRVRRAAGGMDGITAIDAKIVDRNESVAAFDPLRVTLDVTRTGRTGGEFRDRLWQPDGRGVEIEFHTNELLVALFGLGDHSPESADTLIEALGRVIAETPDARPAGGPGRHATFKLENRVPLRDAFLGKTADPPLEDASGRVCAELVAPYPPGIVIVMPGEVLTEEVIAHLVHLREDGAGFADCNDIHLATIRVLAEGYTPPEPTPHEQPDRLPHWAGEPADS